MTAADWAPTGAALAPIAARYSSWLGIDAADVPEASVEDPDEIRALQIIVQMERGSDPDWYEAVTLAARGCAAVCLDKRSEPGGEWYDAIRAYATGHIRKVTRRARAGHWTATADLPGITVAGDGAAVRVLVPGRAAELDKRASRLQVAGTDAPRVEPATWPPVPEHALAVWLNPAVPMTLGKAMAQAGHASMIFAALAAARRPADLATWYRDGLPTAVRPVDPAGWQRRVRRLDEPDRAWQVDGLIAVRDAGFTEVAPGTLTAMAMWRAARSAA